MPKSSKLLSRLDWWKTPLGAAFLTSEAIQVQKRVGTVFGYHLLVLGESEFSSVVAESPILHQVWIHPDKVHSSDAAIQSRYDKLPIAPDSVDLVYLAHCLEFMQNPHEVLREVYRILRPEGCVIIGHFNPWSSWGLWRYLVRYIKPSLWDGDFISLSRLKDWLSLLGFDLEETHAHFFRPPIAKSKLLQRLAWLEKVGRFCFPFWGAGYVVVARKRLMILTPIRPVFKTEKLKKEGGVEPVSGS